MFHRQTPHFELLDSSEGYVLRCKDADHLLYIGDLLSTLEFMDGLGDELSDLYEKLANTAAPEA